jgi:hypothetical protein
MIDEKEKTLRDFVHEAIVPLIEDVIVKKLYQALEVVASEIKSPRKEWVGLTDGEIKNILDCGREGLIDIKKAEQILKEKNT